MEINKILKDALKELKCENPTPVQSATIPLIQSHKDVVVEAVTGSGKTLAFIVPILDKLLFLNPTSVAAIIIAPTRELATQIHTVFKSVLDLIPTTLSLDLIIGGAQVAEKLANSNIIVATPGRLEHLLKNNLIPTRDLEFLILDEADRLLDLGFESTLNTIFSRLPKQRRTGLFSATMSEAINDLIRVGLRNPVKVLVKVTNLENKQQKTPTLLSIEYMICKPSEKLSQLVGLLLQEPLLKTIVYFETCAIVDYFYRILTSLPHLKQTKISSLHGKMDHSKRQSSLNIFSTSKSAIILCTDVAARGLDIPNVDVVIQFSPPQDPKQFSHRCGRTARLDKSGNAIVLLTSNEDTYIEYLKIKKIFMSQRECLVVEDLYPLIVDINKSDREIYDKSLRAFVSWVRSYNEHQASYIFRFKDVDVAQVARMFGLLKLPRMPELKNLKLEYEEVDVDDISYKDKVREKMRLETRGEKKFKVHVDKSRNHGNKTKAWSEKHEAKDRRVERREKRLKKKVAILQKGKEVELKERKEEIEKMQEWDELKDEARNIKKLKRGAVSIDID